MNGLMVPSTSDLTEEQRADFFAFAMGAMSEAGFPATVDDRGLTFKGEGAGLHEIWPAIMAYSKALLLWRARHDVPVDSIEDAGLCECDEPVIEGLPDDPNEID